MARQLKQKRAFTSREQEVLLGRPRDSLNGAAETLVRCLAHERLD